MSSTKVAVASQTLAGLPLHWWEIAASAGSAPELPFLGFFIEGRSAREEAEMPGELRQRVAIPVEDWEAFLAARWGDDGGLIEEWFDAGEELQNSRMELTIEEPDRWERTLQWMRTLAVATGLRPT
jgi:hypothetical protein